MQINKVSNSNFNGRIIYPQNIKSRLEIGIIDVLRRNNQELSTVPSLISKLTKTNDQTIIRINGKNGILNPVKDCDFDVFIEKREQNLRKRIGNDESLAERFLNALYEVSK